jgi:glycerophosphoryl diester phosphodiesterase
MSQTGGTPGPAAARVVAHRGHTRVAPENTLAAVRAALEVGARFIEVDVQLSEDGVPHLFHDRTLERVCGVEGTIAELRTESIEGLRACEPERFGRAFEDERVPTLEQLVTLLAGHPEVHLYVELKRAALERFGAAHVLDTVLPTLVPLAGRHTLISFDLGVLALARQRCDAPIGPVLEAWGQKDDAAVLDLSPEVIFCNVLRLPAQGPLERLVPAPLVVYEIDRADEALVLFQRGVAQVESFAIGELLEALHGAALPETGSA